MFLRSLRLIFALLLSAGCLASAGSRAGAQVQTEITTDPYPIYLSVGQTATISVVVEDAANVYSYYVRMFFNPALLQIQDADPTLAGVQVRNGDFFFPAQSLATVNVVDNYSGVVTYVNSFIDSTMTSSGSGTLLSFDLQALGVGTSNISLSQSYLISPMGEILPATHRNPQVYIGVTASPTATATQTAAPTATATQAQAALPSATPPGALSPTTTSTFTPAAGTPLGSSTPGSDQTVVATATQLPTQTDTPGPSPTLPRAALTHTPQPLPTSIPATIPVTPPILLSTPSANLFEGLGTVGWIAVGLALIWLLVMIGFLVYYFLLKKPGNP